MRLWALIGTIALLLLPFGITHLEIGDGAFEANSNLGLLWTSGDASVFGFSGSESQTFSPEWVEDNGMYEAYFGDGLAIVGLILVIALVINIFLAITSTDTKRRTIPAIILLVCGVALLVLRFSRLSDAESFFYEKEEFLGTTSIYWEIPLGFILALVFSILDFRDK